MYKKINWSETEYIQLDSIFFENETQSSSELSSGTNLLNPTTIIKDNFLRKNISISDINIYTSPLGTSSLRNAVRQYETSYFNINFPDDYTPFMTSGAADGLRIIFQFLKEKEMDNILVLGLQYPIVFQSITNVNLSFYQLLGHSFNDGYLPKPEDIQCFLDESSIKFSALFLTQPNNPTGTLYKNEDFSKVVRMCKKNNIYIIYEKIGSDIPCRYSDSSNIDHGFSIELYKYWDKFIIIDSLSKKRAISGLRIGYVLANKEVCNYANLIRFGDCPITIGHEAIKKDLLLSSLVALEARGKVTNLVHMSSYDVQKKDINDYKETILSNLRTFSLTLSKYIDNITCIDSGFNCLIKLNFSCNEFEFAKDLFESQNLIIYPLNCFTLVPTKKLKENKLIFRLSLAEEESTFKKSINSLNEYLSKLDVNTK
ncbi:pyridoxal phosphate-dependent aminotransferase [Carnobacterium mobile]|uniref:pyridoxal phosphate-dependent aminotransferase n=1 Tax=Carnobacterium mobile TaxID=2750 RepID=UPI000553BF10|nr:pyridoxal phosphate-dependent aminotransferase [Carnobacterium mobile]